MILDDGGDATAVVHLARAVTHSKILWV